MISFFSTVLLLLAVWSSPTHARRWMPAVGKLAVGDDAGKASACYNEMKAGGTVLAQCGAPTATQIATVTRDDTDVTQWVGIQDHSVRVVSHAGVETEWGQTSFSGFGSTNWQACTPGAGQPCDMSERIFTTQAYTYALGGTTGNPSGPSPASSMNFGYTSYFIQNEVELGEQQFFLASPESVNYYLSGCPMYEVGQTDANQNYNCPKKEQAVGQFKFSVIGFLSGATINSAKPAASPANGVQSSPDNKDIMDYKTMIYRSTLDVGALGANAELTFKGDKCGVNGKSFKDITATDDLAGCSMHMKGDKSAEITVAMQSTYSSGSYTRNKADLESAFGSFPCNGNLDSCTLDLTGWADAPNSFPEGANTNVKKVGTKGTTTSAQLKTMAGAPSLEVTNVSTMKITMQPGSCTGRPATPAAQDPSGRAGTGWVNAPTTCPWWYRATKDVNNVLQWAVDKDIASCLDGNTCDKDKQLVQDDVVTCESGTCWFIDFHIDLGGTTADSRTVFGNPDNSDLGWEKGTFFMYDPSIGTEKPPAWMMIYILSVLGGAFAIVVAFKAYYYFNADKDDKVEAVSTEDRDQEAGQVEVANVQSDAQIVTTEQD